MQRYIISIDKELWFEINFNSIENRPIIHLCHVLSLQKKFYSLNTRPPMSRRIISVKDLIDDIFTSPRLYIEPTALRKFIYVVRSHYDPYVKVIRVSTYAFVVTYNAPYGKMSFLWGVAPFAQQASPVILTSDDIQNSLPEVRKPTARHSSVLMAVSPESLSNSPPASNSPPVA